MAMLAMSRQRIVTVQKGDSRPTHRAMWRSPLLVAAVSWLVGCGGSTASHGSRGGAGGTGGGVGGASGTAGTTDAGLPTCALATSLAGEIGPDAGHGVLCNTIPNPGTFISAVCGVEADGGVALDGGAVERPAGGVLRDGDYTLVGWQIFLGSAECTVPVHTSISSGIRLFDGGTVMQEADVSNEPSSLTTFNYNWLNCGVSASENVISFTMGDCGGLPFGGYQSMAYTASGDDLTLFQTTGGFAGGGQLIYTYAYRRTCSRP